MRDLPARKWSGNQRLAKLAGVTRDATTLAEALRAAEWSKAIPKRTCALIRAPLTACPDLAKECGAEEELNEENLTRPEQAFHCVLPR
jgi:hypothetical protein